MVGTIVGSTGGVMVIMFSTCSSLHSSTVSIVLYEIASIGGLYHDGACNSCISLLLIYSGEYSVLTMISFGYLYTKTSISCFLGFT